MNIRAQRESTKPAAWKGFAQGLGVSFLPWILVFIHPFLVLAGLFILGWGMAIVRPERAVWIGVGTGITLLTVLIVGFFAFLMAAWPTC
ncbi:MAG: hypothetical protein RL885_06190 [Planctomycetota bacterium]